MPLKSTFQPPFLSASFKFPWIDCRIPRHAGYLEYHYNPWPGINWHPCRWFTDWNRTSIGHSVTCLQTWIHFTRKRKSAGKWPYPCTENVFTVCLRIPSNLKGRNLLNVNPRWISLVNYVCRSAFRTNPTIGSNIAKSWGPQSNDNMTHTSKTTNVSLKGPRPMIVE